MIRFNNNFTTPEQSKRLLELGVPADSADCFYCCSTNKEHIASIPLIYSEEDKDYFEGRTYPCWSVGRLMEIYDICRCYDGDREEVYGKETYIETYVSAIEEAVLDDMFDFSKLEE